MVYIFPVIIAALTVFAVFVFVRLVSARSNYLKLKVEALPFLESEAALQEVETQYAILKKDYNEALQSLRQQEEMWQLYNLSTGTMDASFARDPFSGKSLPELESALRKAKEDAKGLVKAKKACVCALGDDVAVNGSKAEARKLINREIKLRLRCLDNEFKLALSVVDWNNVERLKKRCEITWAKINESGEIMQTTLRRQYFDLKMLELELAHEINMRRQQIKEDEREERRLAAEAQREEERIQRAAAKARNDREVMEALVAREFAKLEADNPHAAMELESLKQKLERLRAAETRVLAMAELTRAGYVYIISNRSSFGDQICKVGMTRRVDPNDRVKELGDASVPDLFDVHAFVYSEDAPELEKRLHDNLEERRLNLVNRRKEFFRVSPDEVISMIRDFDPSLEIEIPNEA